MNKLQHRRIDYDYNRILLLDLEISPNVGRFYDSPWEARIIKTEQYQYLLSFSYKWLGKKSIYTYALPDFPNWEEDRTDDSALVTKLWEVMNQADALCAHNLKKFDAKKANTRFLVNHLRPLKQVPMIDTLVIARSKFGFIGNSLNDLCKQLKIGKKLDKTHSDLWEDCLEGDVKAWRHLKEYNRHDIVLLEALYMRLAPWIQPFPRLRVDNGKCPQCGSTALKKNGMKYYKNASAQRYACLDCGNANVYGPTTKN